MVILKAFNQQRSANQLAVIDRPTRMPHLTLIKNASLHERCGLAIKMNLEHVQETIEKVTASKLYSIFLSRHYQAYLEQRDMLLSQAKDVLGSRDLAAQWFNKPARGLDYRPPCSVVTDVHGYRLVRDYLERIKYGVYC
ncbi:antitoxin Xre/MbcA/ParS toxin-binding domain-containing protein [Pseudomonas sp. NPDC087817]|uniref:antitoxin Xre/MbcA/ParS toxin-binding domain-containing protein n=1 Tax=Pseudomonas sp. NPDC087817 TaxID=3364451 RepID=UPI00382F4017